MKNIRKGLATLVVSVVLFVCMIGASSLGVLAYNEEKPATLYTEEFSAKYEKETVYSIGVRLSADSNVSSFSLDVGFPGCVDVKRIEVGDIGNADNAVFEGNYENGMVRVAYSSATEIKEDCLLFTVYFTIPEPVNMETTMYVNNMQFTNMSAEHVDINVNFGRFIIGEGGVTLVKGDVNGDGVIGLDDLVIIQRSIVNSNYRLTKEQFNTADVDNNGCVDIFDCQYIQMFLIGKISSFDDIGGGSSDTKVYYYKLHFIVDGKVAEVIDLAVPEGAYIGEFINNEYGRRYTINGLYMDENKEKVFDDRMANESDQGTAIYGDVTLNSGYTINVSGVVRFKDGETKIVYSQDVFVADGAILGKELIDFVKVDGLDFIGYYADPDGKESYSEAMPVTSNMKVYLIFDEAYSQPEQISISVIMYMDIDGEYLSFNGDYSYVEAGTVISDKYNSDSLNTALVKFEGLYYDDKFEKPVNDTDTVSSSMTLYAKFTKLNIGGTYNLYQNVEDSEGNSTRVLAGSITLTDDGAATIRMGENVIEAKWANLNDQLYISINEKHSIMMRIYYDAEKVTEIELFYDFDGNGYETLDTLVAIAGTYDIDTSTLTADGTPINISYQLNLFDNGVFSVVLAGKFSLTGTYKIKDGNIVVCHMMGSPQYFALDLESKTASAYQPESYSFEFAVVDSESKETLTNGSSDLTEDVDLYSHYEDFLKHGYSISKTIDRIVYISEDGTETEISRGTTYSQNFKRIVVYVK